MIKRVAEALITRAMAQTKQRRQAMVLAHVRGRLLDIGCGENRLVRQYKNGIGVDVYDWGDVDLVVQDSAQLPFPDRSFDTISLVACLNHMANREAALKEAYRLLKDDGRLLVTMIPPFISRIWHKMIAPWDFDQEHRGMREGEVWGFTRRQVKDLLARTGFDIVARKRFVLKLNNLYMGSKKPGPRL